MCVIALRVINCILVPVMLVASYGGLVNPDFWAIPAMVAMTLPFWTVVELLMLVVTLLVSRRDAVIPGLTLLVCLGGIWNICPLNLPHAPLTEAQERRSFTLMSYNTFAFHDVDDITYPWGNRTADNIIRANPDILCMSESFSVAPNPNTGVTWEQADTVAYRYPYVIRGDKGAAIYSRFPLTRIETAQPPEEWAYWLCGEADIKGERVLIITVHLQSIGLTPEDREMYAHIAEGNADAGIADFSRLVISKLSAAFRARASQARKLRALIERLGYDNVIVCGDFNDITGCYAIHRIMDTGMHDAYRTVGCGPMITYHAKRFYFHIDHVLYRGALEPVSIERGRVPSSDHYPVHATFIVGS